MHKTLGQRTRDTFELGDVFFRLDEPACEAAKREAERFLDLIFGKPALSPRAHEHAMYLAYAASLRSADLSRQVGATLVNVHGDVIAVGANDVPRVGGGQYGPGEADHRDHVLGYDSNSLRKLTIARDIFERTHPGQREDPAAFAAFEQDVSSAKARTGRSPLGIAPTQNPEYLWGYPPSTLSALPSRSCASS